MIAGLVVLAASCGPCGPAGPLATPIKMITVYPKRTRQTIDNFGASDSWTVEPLMRWPEPLRAKIADLLFDREKGIGLSAWRHNIGGGIDHETITNPMRTVDSYEREPGKFDWNAVPGQRWMLKAAKDRGVEQFVFYAVTPPKWMTLNGHPNCTEGEGSTNLMPGFEDRYARYLVDIAAHYLKQGYRVTHISPINEPGWEWNGLPKPASQEGNRASNAEVMAVGKAVVDEIRRRKLPLKLLSPEAGCPQDAYAKSGWMSTKYKADYGDFGELFAKSKEWVRESGTVYGYHSYCADGIDLLVPCRQRLREALDKVPGMRVWHTEYCQMAGPHGEGGWGRDLGMTLALNVARLIHCDLTIAGASAWQWWLGVSDANYKDGLVYVDGLDGPSGTISAGKTLWALGNFSRYVRPGYVRVDVDGGFDGLDGLLVSAYKNPATGSCVVVLINMASADDEVSLKGLGDGKAKAAITSDRTGDDLREMGALSLASPIAVPARSVMTLVTIK